MTFPRPFRDGSIVVTDHARKRFCERIEDATRDQIASLVREAERIPCKETGIPYAKLMSLNEGETFVIHREQEIVFIVSLRSGDGACVVVTCWDLEPLPVKPKGPKPFDEGEPEPFQKMTSAIKRAKRRDPKFYREHAK